MNVNGQAPRILAINDSPEILVLLREIFEEEGFRITTRTHDATDLDEVKRINPDLIILDYSAEAESRLLHHLTDNAPLGGIPVVLCTGARREIEAIKAELDAMGVAVVFKPFDIDVLVDVVREALDRGCDAKASLPPLPE